MTEITVVTCVYCGHQYPDGTPTAKHELLTEHIKICEKHPLREAENKIEILRKALVGLVGVTSKEDLDALELIMRQMPAPDIDKVSAVNAINALRMFV